MPRLAANIGWLFGELPLLERFAAAAECGFEAVEYRSPHDVPAATIAARLRDCGLKLILFNLAEGDRQAGELGIAALPGRERDFDATVERAIEYSLALDCPHMHVIAGRVPSPERKEEMEATFISNLRRAAEMARPHGIELVIEPVNQRDLPDYLLTSTAQALRIIEKVGLENIKLELDIYHCQISEGNVTELTQKLKGRFSHVQISGVPDRNEPDRGEIDYGYVLNALDQGGYPGWVSLEYRPRGDTRQGLEWARKYGISP